MNVFTYKKSILLILQVLISILYSVHYSAHTWLLSSFSFFFCCSFQSWKCVLQNFVEETERKFEDIYYLGTQVVFGFIDRGFRLKIRPQFSRICALPVACTKAKNLKLFRIELMRKVRNQNFLLGRFTPKISTLSPVNIPWNLLANPATLWDFNDASLLNSVDG